MAAFRIATFNANSIRSRLPIVLDWLKTEKPDVLALQELKCMDDQFPRADFEKAGWFVETRGQKAWNGVAFISKKPLTEVDKTWDPSGSGEARTITAHCGDWFLVNTYVPQGNMVPSPKFDNKLNFFAGLKKLFAQRVSPDQPALWMGDLNIAQTEIDLHNPQRNAEDPCYHPLARAAFGSVKEKLWIDLFREKEPGPGHYTYWDYLWPKNFETNKGWRIDLIMGTPAAAKRLNKIWIDKKPRALPKPSDHTFLVAEFK